MTSGRYGAGPVDLGPLNLEWDEFMHYLYLPVRMPAGEVGLTGTPVRLPARLKFLSRAVHRVWQDAQDSASHLRDPYVYVTARRGYATPGNPLNRPGWHCDDFGGTDLNYIWSDTYPTRFLLSDEALSISADDEQSMRDMKRYAKLASGPCSCGNIAVYSEKPPMMGPHHQRACSRWAEERGEPIVRVEDGPVGHLLRLDPYVIHDTPLIKWPGGMRSFFKISVSSHRYNLRGNSHNHLLDYDWPMYDRETVRNQPQGGNRDYFEEPAS